MQTPRLNPRHAPRTLNVSYARILVGHLQQTRPELLHTLDARQLGFLDETDPLARCTLSEWHALMDAAEQMLGVRDLVPELAAQFKPWHAGLLGFTLMTSDTVHDLATLLKRFHHLLNDVFGIDHGVSGPRFFLRLQATTPERSLRLARLSLCVWAQRLRWLTGRSDLKMDVSFEGPPPDDVGRYRRIFGGTVRFDQDENVLTGDAVCAGMVIVSRDTASHSLLQGQAVKQLALLSRSEDRFIDQLQGLIRARLDVGKFTLEDMAAELKLPARTLQRRLEEAGLKFRLMVDDVRKSQAEQCLRDTPMPLAELAASLGFADHASFNRAFKRWTGQSPGAFRRAQASLDARPTSVA
jgi:AraC-like DNA-binding protein